jgi:hypothetical protein
VAQRRASALLSSQEWATLALPSWVAVECLPASGNPSSLAPEQPRASALPSGPAGPVVVALLPPPSRFGSREQYARQLASGQQAVDELAPRSGERG